MASGDLSTTNYLIALNQRAERFTVGIELEKQTRIALKNLMLQSGRLIDLPPVQHFSIDNGINKMNKTVLAVFIATFVGAAQVSTKSLIKACSQ